MNVLDLVMNLLDVPFHVDFQTAAKVAVWTVIVLDLVMNPLDVNFQVGFTSAFIVTL